MKNHVMKTNRAFKEFCVLGGLAYSVCGVAQERPNIIVFLVDDMGLMDTSVPFLADESGRLVPYSEYGETGQTRHLLFYFLCTKCKFPFQSFDHDRTKCDPAWSH